jgi:putative ATP-dependent endonuclease of OLD family
MRIKNVSLKNFRLLSSASINLEDDITLIVGKNNTGKTSFLEAIKIFTSGESKLTFEDFSQSTYSTFKEIYNQYTASLQAGITESEKEALEKQIHASIPRVELAIEFIYDKSKDSLIELSEFITDLDDARNDATVLVCYESNNSISLLSAFHR